MREIINLPGFRVVQGDNGHSLVTTREWSDGATLFRFRGKEVPFSEATVYALQIGRNLFLQSSPEPRYYDDYVNHSCAPSARVEFRSEGVYLVAMMRLHPGDEVTFDYNTTEFDMLEQERVMGAPCTFECSCGAEDCAGRIRGFRYLTREQQDRRLPWLSPYLRHEYEDSAGI